MALVVSGVHSVLRGGGGVLPRLYAYYIQIVDRPTWAASNRTVIHSRVPSIPQPSPKHPPPPAVFRPISRTTSGLVIRTSVYSHSRRDHSHESGSTGNDRGATCAGTLAPPPGGGGSRPRPLCGSLLPVSHPDRLPWFSMLHIFSFILLLESEF